LARPNPAINWTVLGDRTDAHAILSSASHDLRIPLATITGAASGLLEEKDQLGLEARHGLAKSIYNDARRPDRLVRNLLNMTRLGSGTVQLQKEWQPFEEIVRASGGLEVVKYSILLFVSPPHSVEAR
jgi:K+-sensing histidine kinase KdpD